MEMTSIQSFLNPNLKDFWQTKGMRNRVLYGGRSSSKSWDAAGFAVFLAANATARFLCVRQFQNKIEESVYNLIKFQAERMGIGHEFTFRDSSIVHNKTKSKFIFYGIARNLSSIKSTEGIDVMWHEESDYLTEEQWNIIDPTLKKEGSQHWLIFNPRFASDFVYRRFVLNPPPDTIVRKVNYLDNPFLSTTMLKVIEATKQEDIESYTHIYLGEPLSDDERVIIKRSWIDAAIDAHKILGFEPSGRHIIGFDVADDGADKCANVEVYGSVVLWCDEWKGQEDELLKSCMRTYRNAVECGAEIRYDCIGVGAACGAKFDELNASQGRSVHYSKFNSGDAVFKPDGYYLQVREERIKNKDHFSNLKSQTWWLVADRFRATYDAIKNGTKYPEDKLISIDSKIPMLEKLKTELSTPRRDFDMNGKVKVESKKDLAKRDVPSPNLADAFVMCFAPIHEPFKITQAMLESSRKKLFLR